MINYSTLNDQQYIVIYFFRKNIRPDEIVYILKETGI